MMFSIAPGYYMNERLPENFFREITEYGFNAMLLGIDRKFFTSCPEDVSDLKHLCGKYHVEVEQVHCDVEVLNANKIREAKSIICDNLRLTSEIGSRYLIVHSSIFADPDNIIRDENGKAYPGFSVFRDVKDKSTGMLERVKEGMAFYAEKAGELGVIVALETDLKMNKMLLDFISEADTGSCGLCFDTGHAQIESDAVEVAKLIGQRVVCMHIHDNDGKEDLHLPPFKGTIDWDGVIRELANAGYDGYFSFECLKGTMDDIVSAREKIIRIGESQKM